MAKHAKKSIVTLNVRLPVELHRALVESAATTSPPISLNSEIIRRLQISCDQEEGGDVSERIARLEEEFARLRKEISEEK